MRIVMIIMSLVGLAGILVVEGFSLADPAEGDTLSEIVADVTDVTRAMPFVLGALVGHFASRRQVRASGKVRLFMGFSLIPCAVVAHFLGAAAWITAAAGLAAGWALWPLEASGK